MVAVFTMPPKAKALAKPGGGKAGAAKAAAGKAVSKAKAPSVSKAVAKAKTGGKAAGALRPRRTGGGAGAPGAPVVPAAPGHADGPLAAALAGMMWLLPGPSQAYGGAGRAVGLGLPLGGLLELSLKDHLVPVTTRFLHSSFLLL